MQGRGVTNFDNKPSHAITAATTEFDDALLQHGIVTEEQVMLAKGASVQEAARLAHEKRAELTGHHCENDDAKDTQQDDDDDDDSFVDEEDVEFLARYRRERLKEMQLPSVSTTVELITRDQWKQKVNEASMENQWVMVTMIDGYCQDLVRQELHQLAREYHQSTFNMVMIEATDAIPNWPLDRVPAVFVYQNGIKQHEWIANRRGEFPPKEVLAELFRQWGLLRNENGPAN
jgi:hypothetical protein